MKIALLTICKERNYGAEMQCYATVKALRKFGHNVKVIDFQLGSSPKSFKSKFIKLLISISPEMISFRKFWRKNIPFTRHYKNLSELDINDLNADLFITGSDQTWNLDITKDKWATYFMSFLPDGIRIASYASSFGEAKWIWSDKTDLVKTYLDRYDHISVREVTGKEILKSTFGLDSTVVLDPTLLHDDYNEIVRPGLQRQTLVYYPLYKNNELENFTRSLADATNLLWINTNKKTRLFGKISWWRTPIIKWIKNIAEASLVVTQSFHGLAFSLIYHRQFIIIQNIKVNNRSSRITGLLAELGLSDRYFTSIKDVEESKIWEKPIDYKEVEKKLNHLRFKSWSYISELN